MEWRAGFKFNPNRRPLLDIMQGKVGDEPAAVPATELKSGESEKLTANGDDEDDEKKKMKKVVEEDEDEEEGPVVVEEEYVDVVMAGPQGGILSK